MDLIKIGKGAKVHTIGLKRSIVVVEDLSQLDSLITVEENGEVYLIDADGNEIHTIDSYAKKLENSRASIYAELQSEISNLKNEVTQAKLLAELSKLKEIPLTVKDHRRFEDAIIKFKAFAYELGAKVVAEMAMKLLGF